MTDKQKEALAIGCIAMRYMQSLGAHTTEEYHIDFDEAALSLEQMLVEDSEELPKWKPCPPQPCWSGETWVSRGWLRYENMKIEISELVNKLPKEHEQN